MMRMCKNCYTTPAQLKKLVCEQCERDLIDSAEWQREAAKKALEGEDSE